MKLPEHIIRELMKGIAEDMSISLILLIKDRENVNEFKIAEKLGMTVNEARHHLYKLSEHNLVSSIRKKDKKKGWHISYWTFNNEKARNLLLERCELRIQQLKDEIEKEKQGNYYVCPNKCTRTDYMVGLESNFTCTECGAIMTLGNVKRRIADLEKERERLDKVKQEVGAILETTKQQKEPKEEQKSQPKKKLKVLKSKSFKKIQKKKFVPFKKKPQKKESRPVQKKPQKKENKPDQKKPQPPLKVLPPPEVKKRSLLSKLLRR